MVLLFKLKETIRAGAPPLHFFWPLLGCCCPGDSPVGEMFIVLESCVVRYFLAMRYCPRVKKKNACPLGESEFFSHLEIGFRQNSNKHERIFFMSTNGSKSGQLSPLFLMELLYFAAKKVSTFCLFFSLAGSSTIKKIGYENLRVNKLIWAPKVTKFIFYNMSSSPLMLSAQNFLW